MASIREILAAKAAAAAASANAKPSQVPSPTTHTFTLSDETMERLHGYLERNPEFSDPVNGVPAGALFCFWSPSVQVVGYHSRKVLITGKESAQFLEKWTAAAATSTTARDPASGLQITRSKDSIPLRATVAASLGNVAGIIPPEPRALGETTPGPDIPFEFPSEKSSDVQKLWLLARQQTTNSLGVWIEQEVDPSGVLMAEHGWLAVRNPSDPDRPLLVLRLPLLNRATGDAPY